MSDWHKKKVERLRINVDKCTGCRACEMACSAFHASPKYSSTNPARSRIRVVVDMLNDEYVPIRATYFTKASCGGRHIYTVNGKNYSECNFCGTICPTRELFKEPDSGLPLKCDLCQDVPPQDGLLCVQACGPGALTYEGIDEEDYEEVKADEAETGLKSLADKYGLEYLVDKIALMLEKRVKL